MTSKLSDAGPIKKSLQALAKSIGELIGEWEGKEGCKVVNLDLRADGVYIEARNSAGFGVNSSVEEW